MHLMQFRRFTRPTCRPLRYAQPFARDKSPTGIWRDEDRAQRTWGPAKLTDAASALAPRPKPERTARRTSGSPRGPLNPPIIERWWASIGGHRPAPSGPFADQSGAVRNSRTDRHRSSNVCPGPPCSHSRHTGSPWLRAYDAAATNSQGDRSQLGGPRDTARATATMTVGTRGRRRPAGRTEPTSEAKPGMVVAPSSVPPANSLEPQLRRQCHTFRARGQAVGQRLRRARSDTRWPRTAPGRGTS